MHCERVKYGLCGKKCHIPAWASCSPSHVWMEFGIRRPELESWLYCLLVLCFWSSFNLFEPPYGTVVITEIM